MITATDPAPARETTAAPGATRLWVVSELYYPEQTSTGYFVTRIAEGLARDYEVHALCSQPTYSARGIVAASRERRNGVMVQRCRSTRLDKNIRPFRLLNLVTFTTAVFATALRRFRAGDMALVVTNPPLIPYAMFAACRLKRARLVLLVHDVYPEVLVATGVAEANSRLVRWWHRASRKLYRGADRIVVLGRDMKALVARYGADDARIRVIPNWGDVDHIEPGRVSGDPLRTRLGLTGKFVVQFMGNMGHSHAMGALLDAAVDLEDQSEIQFVLIGWGARRKWIERQVTERGLQNVTLLPNCPENELPAYLDVCDIAIIPFIPGMAGISVPSRMYNIMAAGKPMLVLADADSEVARVVEEERLGWVVAAERPAELADRILEAKQESKLLAEMGRRARRVAEKKYTLNIVQQEYARLFGEIAHAETHRRRGRSSNCDSAQLTENGARG